MTQNKKIILLLMIYITAVLLLTLVPFRNSVDFEVDYNLTIFKSINNYIKHMGNFGIVDGEAFKFLPFQFIRFTLAIFTVSFKNILGNILIFLPFGFLAPYLIKCKKFISVLVYSLVFSTFIEVMQYTFLTSRRADVDDVILNTLGGILGYLIYCIGRMVKKLESRK